MDTFENLHPRASAGTFTDKLQSAPEASVLLASRPTLFGQIPVNLEGFPLVSNYRFTATALAEGQGGVVPYFTEMELVRVIEPINAQELESDDPQTVSKTGSSFAVNGVELPHIDTSTGRLWMLDTDGGSYDWEVTEGAWFDDGSTGTNLSEIHTERAEKAGGNTFDRAWTMRRDDGKYVTRTVTWFVEAFDDSDSSGREDEDAEVTYSVYSRTEDSLSDSIHGDREYVEDPFAEDHLDTDQVFDTVESAQEFARKRANGAESYFHVDGWNGHAG